MKHASLVLRLAPLGLLLFWAAPRARAAISDGMNAETLLGQLDGSDAAVWNTGVPNYRPSAQGFNSPQDVAVDTATHRLFVADYTNSRVLEFDLDSSNTLVDHTADHVLGQSSFTGFLSGVTQNGMYYPAGVAYDPVGQRLFVSDYNANRVLVHSVSSITDGQNAAYVLGQTSFLFSGAGTLQNRMSAPNKLRYDWTNNRLYVPDSTNNRILVFDASTGTIANGQNAIYVLGQASYTSATANTTINGLSNPVAVEISTAAQKLYVSDYNNNRVLVYDASSLSNGMNASYVIGQSTFNTATSATSQTGLKNPYGLAYDPGGNRLFAAEQSNQRVMVFDVTTSTNNPSAVNVLGQANYTTGTIGTSQSRFYTPRGLAYDAGNSRLYVVDGNNYRVVDHTVSSIVNGQNATDGLGLQDASGAYSWNQYFVNAPPNARGFLYPYVVALDTSSHRLFAGDMYNNRVLEFDLDTNDQLQDRVADHVLGQSAFNHAVPSTGPARMNLPIGLAYDAANQRLFVSDQNNHRVLIYDLSGGLSDGQNAAHVLGQTNFTNSSASSAQNRMYFPRGLAYDSLNSRLYVADYSNNRVLVSNVSTSTLSDGQNAAYVLGQPDFATVTSGLTQYKMYGPRGVALDTAGQRLFVTDTNNVRVLIFDVSSLANNLPATAVLGQSDFTSNGTGTTASRMFAPVGVAHDPVSGRLFVSDPTINRILTFDATSLTNGQNAINVLGQANFTSGTAGLPQNRVSAPQLLALDSTHHRLFIPDYGNHRLLTYLVDLAPSTSTIAAVKGSSSGEVALSWPSAGDEESRGALTGSYRIQYATYTAAWNTTTTPTNATTLTLSTTNVTPGVVQSTTVAGLTGGVTYSFALFTQDGQSNWSGVSNTTTSKPLDSVAPSTSTLTAHPGSSAGEITLTWASAGHDGNVGVLNGNYRIQYATFSAVWSTGGSPADVTTVALATTAVTPGTLRSTKVSGLSTGTAWYFALFTQDDEDNWSGVSNTTSAVTATDVAAPGTVGDLAATANASPGSVHLTWTAPGNDGASGNLTGTYRIQYADFVASWSTATTPANAWTKTVNALAVPGTAQSSEVGGLLGGTPYYFVLWSRDDVGNWSAISNGTNTVTAAWPGAGNGITVVDVAGTNNGLTNGAVAWGDMDGNGQSDLVVIGSDVSGSPQLRVYSYYGAGAFNDTATEVAGAGNGLKNGTLALGDSNNDGSLDILAEGQDSGGNRQLRVYKNNGDGSFATEINVAGVDGGLSNGGVAWGDDDNDGDLDILTSGTDGANNQLRVYQNNGNGTFLSTAIEVAGVNGGLREGGAVWGDYDGDGDMDVLVNGFDGTNNQMRIYKNNANGTFNSTPIAVAGANNGLRNGAVAWGDMDADGQVDVLVNGYDGTSSQLRAYKNNGDGTFGAAVNVAGSNVGASTATVAWGDFNNDGKLDAVAAGRGWQGTGLVGYWKFNEGSGTSAADASSTGDTGTLYGGPTWTTGVSGSGLTFDGVDDYVQMPSSTVYTTNYGGSNRSFSYSAWIQSSNYAPLQVVVARRNNCNSDAHFNIYTSGNKVYLGYYTNLDVTAKVIRSSNSVLTNGQLHHIVWTRTWGQATTKLYVDGVSQDISGDTNNNGTTYEGAGVNLTIGAQKGGPVCADVPYYYFNGLIDDVRIYNRILSSLEAAALHATSRPGVYYGNGDGTFNSAPVEVDPTNGGLEGGAVAMSDVDGDGDVDLAVSGTDGTNPQLRVYLSSQSLTQSNTAPTAPATLATSFAFSPTAVSVASFTWSAGTDSGTGATPANVLTYDVQFSTTSDFSQLLFPGQLGASPRMGSYLKPPKIFNSNTYHGVVLKSTDPWNTQATANYGLRTDTTYYYRVKTVDAALAESAWSTAGTLFAGAPPLHLHPVGDGGGRAS